jgi:RNA polymerase sigma-70 factor (ECF subfamily)
MDPIDPDDDVLELVRQGDVRAALRCLMQRHGAAVYRYCRAELRDATLADDVQQQVFLEAFRDLPRFGRVSTLRIWLFGIARHRVLDAVKHRRRTQRHFEDREVADRLDPRPSPAEAIDEARLRELVTISLARLTEDARTAVLLRFQQGFTFEEMAQICGERAGTLHARVARALPLLRAMIEARLGGAR